MTKFDGSDRQPSASPYTLYLKILKSKHTHTRRKQSTQAVSLAEVMGRAGRQGEWRRVLQLFEEGQAVGMAPNQTSYGAAIAACARVGDLDRALEVRLVLFRVVIIAVYMRVVPSPHVCAWVKWTEARCVCVCVYVPLSARQRCFHIRSITHTQHKQQIKEQLEAAGLAHNRFTFNALLSACEASGELDAALGLLGEFRGLRLRPDVVSPLLQSTAVNALCNPPLL